MSHPALMILIILVPTLMGIGAAFMLRRRLAHFALMPWLGWLMIGAGVPVLLGQVIALAFTETAAQAAQGCETGDAVACQAAGLYFILPLTAGLCAGLGWIAGTLSTRLTRSPNPTKTKD